jgi:predicted nucleic acid-binding Zn ribbon protein
MARKRPKTRPIRAAKLIPQVLDDLGFGSAARGMRIQEHWEEAVGEALAAHAEPGDLRGDTLEVLVSSPVWAQQLQLESPRLLSGLRDALGEDAPSELHFRVARA